MSDSSLIQLVLNELAKAGLGNPPEIRKFLRKLSKELDKQDGMKTLTVEDLLPPWVTKVVQYISDSTLEKRSAELLLTGNNVFKVRAKTIKLDFLTDSGTSAQSDEQWAAMMRADERYAHSETFEEFLPVAKNLFNKKYILPVHQGRTAENIAFSCLLDGKQGRVNGNKLVCTGNSFFDTTAGNIARQGFLSVTADCPESKNTNKYYDFKGNADVEKVEEIILEYGPQNVGFVLMTVVNNTIGGQPVSLKNLHDMHELAKKYDLLFVVDAARIFENAYFIQQREKEYSDKTIKEIVWEITNLADVLLMSGKKDGIANMGGLIATNNEELYDKFESFCILIEGHYSYGGMSGRDIAALTQGLQEGIKDEYLHYRINQVQEFGNNCRRLGIPIQWPPGSNGVFVDAREFLPHIPKLLFPAQSLCVEMYKRYGIRPVEIGLSLSPRNADGQKNIPEKDLVRFTIPRRVYSKEHFDYVLASLEEIKKGRDTIPGLFYEKEGKGNGHFTSRFRIIPIDEMKAFLPEAEAYFSKSFK